MTTDRTPLAVHSTFAAAALANGSLTEKEIEEAKTLRLAQLVADLIQEGDSVTLCGLSGTESLNGSVGVVVDATVLTEGRVLVQLGKTQYRIKLVNLLPSAQSARASAVYALCAALKNASIQVSRKVAFSERMGDVVVAADAPIPVGTQAVVVPEAACLCAFSDRVRSLPLADGVSMADVLDDATRRLTEAPPKPDEGDWSAATYASGGEGGLWDALGAEDLQLAMVVMHVLSLKPPDWAKKQRATWPRAAERRGLPLLWAEWQRRLLDGTTVGRQLERMVAAADDAFALAVAPALAALAVDHLFAAAGLRDTRDTFLHALALVRSRAIRWPTLQPDGTLGGDWGAIPPVADMFNGLPSGDGMPPLPSGLSRQTVELLLIKIADDPPCVSFRATRDLAKGEELIASYATDSTAAFLNKYGVVPEGTASWTNPNDEVWISLPAEMLPDEHDVLRWTGLAAVGYTGPGRDGNGQRLPTFVLSREGLEQYTAQRANPATQTPPELSHLKRFLLMLLATRESLVLAQRGGELQVTPEAMSRALASIIDANIADVEGATQAAAAAATRASAVARGEAALEIQDGVSASAAEAAVVAFAALQARRATAKEHDLLADWRRALAAP